MRLLASIATCGEGIHAKAQLRKARQNFNVGNPFVETRPAMILHKLENAIVNDTNVSRGTLFAHAREAQRGIAATKYQSHLLPLGENSGNQAISISRGEMLAC
jgi:hypothetical protein